MVEFQSKARNCNLEVFPVNKVPASIAEDLDGEIEKCKGCGHLVTLRMPPTMQTVEMEIT